MAICEVHYSRKEKIVTVYNFVGRYDRIYEGKKTVHDVYSYAWEPIGIKPNDGEVDITLIGEDGRIIERIKNAIELIIAF